MNKNLKKYFSTFLISISVFGLLSFVTAQEKQKTKVDSELSLVLPAHSLEMEELLTSIRKMNSNLIFLRSIEKTKKNKLLFAVSRYENSKPNKLEDVFYEQTTNFKSPNTGELAKKNTLISFKKYNKDNKLLFTKVSSPIQGQCSVIYYFMKNNYSTIIYEIKLTGAISEMESMKNITEKIALSVEL